MATLELLFLYRIRKSFEGLTPLTKGEEFVKNESVWGVYLFRQCHLSSFADEFSFLTASANCGPSNTYVVVVVVKTLIQNRLKTRTLAVKMRNAFSH